MWYVLFSIVLHGLLSFWYIIYKYSIYDSALSCKKSCHVAILLQLFSVYMFLLFSSSTVYLGLFKHKKNMGGHESVLTHQGPCNSGMDN